MTETDEASQHISTYGNTLFPYICAYQDLTFSLAFAAADPPSLVAPPLLCAHHTCYAIHLTGRISWTDCACAALQLGWGCLISGHKKQFSDTKQVNSYPRATMNYLIAALCHQIRFFLVSAAAGLYPLGQRTSTLGTQAPFFTRTQVCHKHISYSLWS